MNSRSRSQQQARYRAIFDQAAGGIVLSDLSGRFQMVNQRWCDMLGYTMAEMLQLSIFDLTFPEELPALDRSLSTLVEDRAPVEIDKRYRRKDGTGIWLSVSVSAVLDEAGEPESIMALAIDITERKATAALNAFLAELAERLSPISNAEEMMRTTTRLVGSHLKAHRCFFAEADADANELRVSGEWSRDEAAALRDAIPLSAIASLDWREPGVVREFSVPDISRDALTGDATDMFVRAAIKAFAAAPQANDRGATPLLVVTQEANRVWTSHELDLLRHVVARVWPQVERARAEAELQGAQLRNDQQARFYETIMSGTPDLVYTFDLQHRFTYVNRALLELWGRTWEDSIGKTCWELGYPDWHAAKHDRELEEVKRTKHLVRGEVPFTGANGLRYFDYIFAPVLNDQGEVESIAGTTRDITMRRAIEAELYRETRRRRLLGDAIAVLLTSDDANHMIEELFARVAPELELDSCFAYAADEEGAVLTQQASLGVSPENSESLSTVKFGESITGLVAEQRQSIIESNVQQSTCERLAWARENGVRCYACFPLIAGERLVGTLGFGSTQRDALSDEDVELLQSVARYVTVAYERLRLISELRDADRVKDDFIAMLAHELRNPLAPLRNGLRLMRSTHDTRAVDDARAMMERQLSHMVRLIEDLLDVSRISRSRLTLRRDNVLLSDVIAHALESARPAIESANHTLDVQLPATPVVLSADLTRMAQVFSNLLLNSAKYTPPGGRISLWVELEADDVTVRVHDTGVGIPADALPTVFDMFSRVEHTMERGDGGLGIGLALVRGLVELHGGSVRADSRGAGQGATFTVRLPTVAATPEPVAVPVDEAGEARRAARMRILVADDNHDVAQSMAMLLELFGHEVHVAHDGLDAVNAVERLRPELVFMDVGMPRLSGYEATRRIRAQPGGDRIVIAALTGWGQERDRRESREAGCDLHLVKPVDPTELEQLLDSVQRGELQRSA